MTVTATEGMRAFGVHVFTDAELNALLARERFDAVRESRRDMANHARARRRWEHDRRELVAEVEYLKQRVRLLTSSSEERRKATFARSSRKRYARYVYLCDLHGIAKQTARWSMHLTEIERTLINRAAGLDLESSASRRAEGTHHA